MEKMAEEPLRVLQVVTNMSYGGLENLLMNYYRNIDRNRIQFDFLTHVSIHQDFEEEIEALGGRIYRLPRLNPFSPSYVKVLNRFFAEHPYKVVHSHLDCMSAIPLQAARKQGCLIRIAHSHNSSQVKNLKYPIKLYFRRKIFRYATDLFACGKEAGKWMFQGKGFTIMSNAIDAQEFRLNEEIAGEVRQELGIEDCFVVGHVGQFRTEKNHLFLIDVFAEILKREKRARLVLVGKGPQMQPAIEKVKVLGVQEKVLFLGARADISRLMQAMDVFVLPSTHEGLPVTLIEAQASGLPCVISDGVPLECKLTNDVKQVPLAEATGVWAEHILRYRDYVCSDNYSAIVSAGYDIRSNVNWLEEFYCNACCRN